MAQIDSHAHVFTAACKLAEVRRYTPEREAPISLYLAALDRFGFSHGVLVQPHFLGTDNSYLVDCLKRAPRRLRGVVMLDPQVSDRALDAYQAAGVVGFRVNLIGVDPEILKQARWQDLCRRVAERGWLIEVHAPCAVLPDVLDRLWPCGATLLVDHFGRPDPALGFDDPGLRALEARAASGRIWVKLSAPYRWRGTAVKPYVEALMRAFGPAHLVWGSDWPWTRQAGKVDFARLQAWLADWLPDEAERAVILGQTPARLFRFGPAAPAVEQGAGLPSPDPSSEVPNDDVARRPS